MAVSRHGYSRTNAAFKGPQARRGEVKFIQEAQPHFKPFEALAREPRNLGRPVPMVGRASDVHTNLHGEDRSADLPLLNRTK